MLTLEKNLRGRVSVNHNRGAAVVQIRRHNQRTFYIFSLLAITTGFILFCSVLIPPLLHNFSLHALAYLLPVLAFVLVWFAIGLRIAVWRAFGVDQIIIDGGVFKWKRTALSWKRVVEVPINTISEVRAVTPWHGLRNRVELTVGGRHQTIGDMLLRDESTELALALRRAIGLTR